jgi:hypothetical protein
LATVVAAVDIRTVIIDESARDLILAAVVASVVCSALIVECLCIEQNQLAIAEVLDGSTLEACMKDRRDGWFWSKPKSV